MAFFFGIGIVKSQEAQSLMPFGCLKIDPDRFEVSDVKIAVGFRWKSEPKFALSNFCMFLRYFLRVALYFKLPGFNLAQLVPKHNCFSWSDASSFFLEELADATVNKLAVDIHVFVSEPLADSILVVAYI